MFKHGQRLLDKQRLIPQDTQDAVGSGHRAAPGRNIGLKVAIEQIGKGFAWGDLSWTGRRLLGLRCPISSDRCSILEYCLGHRRGSGAMERGLQRGKPGFHDVHETPTNGLFWCVLVALGGYWDTLMWYRGLDSNQHKLSLTRT